MVRTGEADNQPVAPQREQSGVSWWWLAPCVLALAAFPFVWRPLWQMASTASAVDGAGGQRLPSQLGFTATHEGADWKLVWSRDALTRLNALGAMLTIRDGGVERLQFLSPQDLAAGTVFYIPRTSDLSFNLKVTVANGADIEEQIRVLGAEKTDEPLLAERVPRRIGEASREVTAPAAEPVAPLAQAERAFQRPAPKVVRSAGAGDTALPDVAMPAVAVPQLSQQASAPPLPVHVPPPPAAAPAATAPAASAPAPSAQLIPTISRTEASPLRTIPAAWPRNTLRNGSVDIKIRVRIDERGRVVGATPLQRTVSNYPFVDSALTAARMWTFKPAVENGKPVPAESVLTFKFTP